MALDTTTDPGSGAIGVQFAHRSIAVENTPGVHTAATDGVWPMVVEGEGDVRVEIGTAPVAYSVSGVTPIQSVTASATYPVAAFGTYVIPLDGGAPNGSAWPGIAGGPGDLISLPSSAVQVLSTWSASLVAPPIGFVAGKSYTFVLTGDPEAAPLQLQDGGVNPQYDGRGVHLLAIPNAAVPLAY